jgi:magnesium transporter
VAAGATWIDLLDPTAEELRRSLPVELHETVVARLLAPARHRDEPRPRLEAHDDYVTGSFLVPVVVRAEDRVYYQEVDLVLMHDLVVTVRKTPELGGSFDPTPAREACEARGALGAGAIAYQIVDAVAEAYLHLVDGLVDEIEELEDGIETWEPDRIRERFSTLRHDLLHVRRTLVPTRDAVRRVIDKRLDVHGGKELFPRRVEISFGDAHDKLLRVVDGLDLARDLLASVRDYHQSKVANDQNNVMKTLTVIASLLLFPTFIVGVYGQNFRDVPELRWGFGYGFSWGLILVITLAQLAFFRWRRWI